MEPSPCLELIAGEFLATYEALGGEGREVEEDLDGQAPRSPEEEVGQASTDDTLMCPEGDDLPSSVVAPYSKTHRMVHAGIIGVKGKAPHRLEWRRPELMEKAAASMAEPPGTATNLIEDEPEGEYDDLWLPAGYSPSWDEPVVGRSR